MEVSGHLSTPPPGEELPVHIVKEAGWTRVSVWLLWTRGNFVAPARSRIAVPRSLRP